MADSKVAEASSPESPKATNHVQKHSSTGTVSTLPSRVSSTASHWTPHWAESHRDNTIQRDTCVIDPETSSWLWKWDIFGGLLLVVVAVMTPFEAGFLEDVQGLIWFNNFVNSYFVIDVTFQFFTAFERRTKFGSVWVFKRKAIWWHYVKGWFFIDFISVIPYGLLLPGSPVGALKVIRMIRLTKLLKLVRGARLVRRWQAEIGFSYRHGSLYLLLIMVLAVAHWLACILGLIHRLQVDSTDVLCENGLSGISDSCGFSWLTVASTWERFDPQKELSPWDAYLYSLHMAMSMLVHPHSNAPTRPGERFAFIFLNLCAGFMWTQVISRSTAIRTSIDRNNLIYHQTMDDINALAKEYHLSWDVRRRLRRFFIKTRTSTQADTWRALTLRMSPQLRRDTAREINRTWIKRIRFLARCLKDVGFITDVSQAMQVRMFSERESFGELNEMYVMVEGVAALHKTMRVITPGEAWGEDHLILTNPKLLEDNVAVSMVFVEVQILSKADFDKVLLDHDRPREIMKRQKCKYLLKRGIITVAHQIREERKAALIRHDTNMEDCNRQNSTESILDSLEHRYHERAKTSAAREASVEKCCLDNALKNLEPYNHQPLISRLSEQEIAVESKLNSVQAEQKRIAEKQDLMEVKLDTILSLLQRAFPDLSQDNFDESSMTLV